MGDAGAGEALGGAEQEFEEEGDDGDEERAGEHLIVLADLSPENR